jgi:acyl carrier protein
MEEKLKKIFADLFSVGVSEIEDSMSIETVQSWDSLRQMQIVASLEENFDIAPFTVDEIVSMRSFSKIKEVLKGKLGGADNGM